MKPIVNLFSCMTDMILPLLFLVLFKRQTVFSVHVWNFRSHKTHFLTAVHCEVCSEIVMILLKAKNKSLKTPPTSECIDLTKDQKCFFFFTEMFFVFFPVSRDLTIHCFYYSVLKQDHCPQFYQTQKRSALKSHWDFNCSSKFRNV